MPDRRCEAPDACRARRRGVLGHAAVAVGAGDHVDRGGAEGEALLEVLGHAADDCEHGPGALALERAELGGARNDALLGLLAHRARVDDDDVREVGALGRARSRAAASTLPIRSLSATFIWQP